MDIFYIIGRIFFLNTNTPLWFINNLFQALKCGICFNPCNSIIGEHINIVKRVSITTSYTRFNTTISIHYRFCI